MGTFTTSNPNGGVLHIHVGNRTHHFPVPTMSPGFMEHSNYTSTKEQEFGIEESFISERPPGEEEESISYYDDNSEGISEEENNIDEEEIVFEDVGQESIPPENTEKILALYDDVEGTDDDKYIDDLIITGDDDLLIDDDDIAVIDDVITEE